jgi:hypothetical protein
MLILPFALDFVVVVAAAAEKKEEVSCLFGGKAAAVGERTHGEPQSTTTRNKKMNHKDDGPTLY